MKHVIIIGFKHVGKSTIGRRIAENLNKPFIDLDDQIEAEYKKENGTELNCRLIMMQHGSEKFCALERAALKKVLQRKESSIIALGGGTPIDKENRELIKEHNTLCITANRGNIYERIMLNGHPAFFPKDEDTYTAFRRIWDERDAVYREVAGHCIENNDSLDVVVQKAMCELEVKCK